MLKPKFLFIPLFLFFVQLAWGQKLYFSNIPRLNTKAFYNKVIGENAGGIYVLRFKDQDMRSGFSIERYTHNLDFVESENFELGKKESLLKVFTSDSGLVFVKVGFEKEAGTIAFLSTGFSIRETRMTREIYRSSRMDKDENHVLVNFSADRQVFSVWVSETDSDNNQVFAFLCVDYHGTVRGRGNFNTRVHYREVEPRETSVMNNGAVALLYSHLLEDKRATDPGAEEHFLLYATLGSDVRVAGLGDDKFFLPSVEITPNEFTGKFLISGFYDYKKPDASHGVVSYYFSPSDSTVKGKFEAFDRKFVAFLIGARQEEDGSDPEKFFVRKLVPRNDGGYLLVGEFFEVTQQMETFYLNGVPQTSSKSVYNYNDILLVSVDSIGAIEWRHNINKRQNSFASMSYMHSMGVYVCEKNVNLMYNDNSAQSNRVIHVRLSRNGVMEQRIILNSDNEYTAIIPMEGKQTGYNRFVTPIFQSRQTMLMQVVDDK